MDELEANNPIEDISKYEFEELIEAHTQYLNQAILAEDTLKQLFGYGYLFQDYMNQADYVSGKKMTIEVDKIVRNSGINSWIAWLHHLKGILSSRLLDYEEALRHHGISEKYWMEAADSLGMAIALEQSGSMYKSLERYDTSEQFYRKAWPLITKYASAHSIGATANNYGTLLSHQDRPSEAIPYFERVIAIFDSLSLKKEMAKGMNNLADAYRRLGKFRIANEMYEECLQFNEANNIPENLLSNYSGLHEIALEEKNYKDAHDILNTYIVIRDSLTGAQVKEQIAQFEMEYETQEIALELERQKNALMKSQKGIAIRNFVILLCGLLAIMSGIILWYRNRSYNVELSSKRDKLEIPTQFLHEKNKELFLLKKSLKQLKKHLSDQGAKGELYNIKILTDDDWVQFIGLFERAYPEFIIKLKDSSLNLTPAEVRLFLLLKLRRSRAEIAVILGVSTDSVKKARTRLRSKIGLEKSHSLENFITNFE